jgi:hypothetical protein
VSSNTIYVLQNQNLLEQTLPVFIGAFAAFLFSVITLYIGNRVNQKNVRKQLLSNLSRELKYNVSVIDDIKKSIDKVIPKILANEKEPYVKLKYSKFMTNFTQEAYRNGILFELLSEYDIAIFDDVLSHYNNGGGESWLRGRLKALSGGSVTMQDVVYSFQYEKDELDTHIRVINDVLGKLEQAK